MASSTINGCIEYSGIYLDSVLTSTRLIEGIRDDLQLTPDNVIVAAYPKSGTTWMEYLVFLVLRDGETNCGDALISSEVHKLEFEHPGQKTDEMLKMFAETPAALFSTHLHFRFLQRQVLENKVKVIVVMRNPKDVLVSFYHFYRMNKGMFNFRGSWNEFFELFRAKQLWAGDFFDFNVECWKVRDAENVLVMTYEDMKKNLSGVVSKVAKFLGRDLSDDVVQKIAHLTSFDQMKDDPAVNLEHVAKAGRFDFNESKFMRKGEVGGWKSYFSEEQSKYVDDLCEERCAPLGLMFQQE